MHYDQRIVATVQTIFFPLKDTIPKIMDSESKMSKNFLRFLLAKMFVSDQNREYLSGKIPGKFLGRLSPFIIFSSVDNP